MSQHDLFISHASEDKDDFVRELADVLGLLRVDVWYDEFSLNAGDSLSESIDRGLERSRFGVVIISPNFISKPWPKRELSGLTALELVRGKIILPVWLNVSAGDVLKFSPTLADKKAISGAAGVERAAVELLRTIRPDLYVLLRENHFIRSRRISGKVESASLSRITKGPRRRDKLDPLFLMRARLVREVLIEVMSSSWVGWIDDFLRDVGPELELQTWENIAGVYAAIVNEFRLESVADKRKLFSDLIGMSVGGRPDKTMNHAWSHRLADLYNWARSDTGEDPRFVSSPAEP